MRPDWPDGGRMDKRGCQPLHTGVLSGDAFPGSPATISLLSLRVLSPAPGLLSGPPQGGAAMMNAPGNPLAAVPRDRGGALPAGTAPGLAPSIHGGLPPGSGTNTYCATCLRTRRFLDRATHLSCETCSRRLDRVVAARRTAG